MMGRVGRREGEVFPIDIIQEIVIKSYKYRYALNVRVTHIGDKLK